VFYGKVCIYSRYFSGSDTVFFLLVILDKVYALLYRKGSKLDQRGRKNTTKFSPGARVTVMRMSVPRHFCAEADCAYNNCHNAFTSSPTGFSPLALLHHSPPCTVVLIVVSL
jgi:hypothetical protein